MEELKHETDMDRFEAWDMELDHRIAELARSEPDKPVITLAMERIFNLEKLVIDMWFCMTHGDSRDCSPCPRLDVCELGIVEFEERARELGIKVE
jgi:hypothetical protein